MTDITEDDRRRAEGVRMQYDQVNDGRVLMFPRLLEGFIALALAETRRQAEERYAREIHTPNARKWINHDTQQRARILDLEDENKRLQDSLQECKDRYGKWRVA